MSKRPGTSKPVGEARLRVGVIGAGGMGRGHCATIRGKVRELELTAVCDCDPATAAEVAASRGAAPFTSHRAMIRSGLCDAAIVAAPHPHHPALAIDCMKAGLHVLCEKPLSERISTAEAMVRTADRCGVTLAVMYQLRFHPPLRKALDLVRGGALGRVLRATLIAPDYRTQAYYDSGAWRATWEGEGGGVLLNQSPHIMDVFVNLTGLPEKVLGRVATCLHDMETEDRAEALLSFPGGGTGYVYATTTEPGSGQAFEIYCEKGTLIYRDGGLRLLRFDPPVPEFTRTSEDMWARMKPTETPPRYRKGWGTHADVMRNFARHVLRGEELLCSGRSALAQVELANAILLSGHTGREVKLPISRAAYDRFLRRLRKTSTFRKKRLRTQRVTDPGFRR